MAIREGKWRCRSCSRVNLGRDLGCQGCGEPRGEVEFFLDDDAPEVTDAGLLARAHAGVDWICAYCSSSNAAATQTCSGCGGPRHEGKGRDEGPVVGRKAARPVHSYAPATANAPSGRGLLAALLAGPALVVGGVALMVFFCCALFMLGAARSGGPVAQQRASFAPETPAVSRPPEEPPPPPPRHVIATVTSVSWRREVHVERLRTFEEKGKKVPEGGRLLGEEQAVDGYKDVKTGTRTVTKTRQAQIGTKQVTKTKREQVGTRKVKVGTRSKGNGFFEDVYKDEPVYGDRPYTVTEPVYGPQTYTEEEPVYEKRPIHVTLYRYEIARWASDPDVVARGEGLAPAWPAVSFDAVTREKGRSEWMTVRFAGAAGEALAWMTGSCERIARFEPGTRWDLLVDHEGRVLSASDPPPADTAAVRSATPGGKDW